MNNNKYPPINKVMDETYFSREKSSANAPYDKHDEDFHEKKVNELAAQVFLSTWDENGCTDKIIEVIDKEVPAEFRTEVYLRAFNTLMNFMKEKLEPDESKMQDILKAMGDKYVEKKQTEI